MFEIKDYICHPGAELCEDSVGFGNNYAFVLDGASGLTGNNIIDNDSDASWFVKRVKDALVSRFENGDTRDISEILYEILGEIHKVYFGKLDMQNSSEPADSPSAAMALFRERNGNLEFFGLGDCIGVFTDTDDNTHILYDEALSKLDYKAIEYMLKIKKQQGLSLLKAKQKSMDVLIKNRQLRNKPGGYWILDPSAKGVPHATTYSIPINKVKSVSAFSDGFSQLVDCFGEFDDYSRLHNQMQNTPLKKLYERLYELQKSDPDCNKYPRFKLRDDASAVWAIIK